MVWWGFVSLAGCSTPQAPAAPMNKTLAVGTQSLRERAQELWLARQSEDWSVVFQFEDPDQREHATVEQFVAWCNESEPFREVAFTLHDLKCDGDLAWVDLESTTQMRRFPDVPPRTTRTWEKWHRLNGSWYPVPKGRLEDYPASPSERELEDEPRLRARFEASWTARQHQDWTALYALTDPRDHEAISESALANAYGRYRFVSAKVQWVEVIGQRGRIRVAIECALNDPSLTKMPSDILVITEKWIKHEEVWFLDLLSSTE